MECEFSAGDLAVTKDVRGILERYRGLTCRVVDDKTAVNGFVSIVFDEDPNGCPGRIYDASVRSLIHLGGEPDCGAISEFLDEI